MNKNLTSFLKTIIILGLFVIPVFIPIISLAQGPIIIPTHEEIWAEELAGWRQLPDYIRQGISDPFTVGAIRVDQLGPLTQNPYANLPLQQQITSLNSASTEAFEYFNSLTATTNSPNEQRNTLVGTVANYVGQRARELERFSLLAQAEIARQNNNITEAERLEAEATELEVLIDDTTNANQRTVQSLINDLTQDSKRTCKLGKGFSIDTCIAQGIDGFFSLILWLLSWLLWLVDTLFAKIIDLTIVGFGDLLKDLNVVNVAWKVVRDVANIFFIFILLYLAISTALQTPGVDTRKVLVNIIIIALVINFSAVFTKVVIDASNITALTFYNLLGVEGKKPDISLYFRSALSWFEKPQVNINNGPRASANTREATNESLAALAKNSGMFILLVITAFTLLAASFLLLIRGISLIILIIVSPLAFLGYGFKPLSEIFNKWLDRLKCDVLFAPLFFFLLYLTFGLFDSIYGGGTTSAGEYNNFASQIVMFLMLNGLMLGSIMIAQKVGCQMGGKAFNFVTNRSKQSLGAMSGFAGRNSLGFLASKAQKSQTLKNLAKKAPRTGWAASTVAQKVAGYGFGSGFGSDKKDAGLGYTQRTEQRQKRQAEQLKLLKNPADRAEYLSNIQRKALTFRGKTLLSASNEDAKKQYGDLPDRDKAELRINAIDTGNTEMIEVLESLQDTLKGEKKESADKEYEKQLRQYLKVATKDFTDKSGKEVKKGDQLTMAQQLEMFDKLGEVFVKNGASDEAKEKQKQKGKELQQISYNTMSDADKVAFTKEAEDNNKKLNTVDTKTRLDTINKFEEEYIKGRGETEQKFYDEKEKIDKRATEQKLKEAKREAKTRIDKVFEGQNKATYELTEANIQILKGGIDKLSSEDISNLDVEILKNTQFQELLQKGDYSKIYANTEKIGRENLSEIKNNVLSNPNISDEVKDGIEPTYSKRKKAEAEKEGQKPEKQPSQPQGPTIITPETPYKEPRSRTKYDSNGNKINDDYTEPIKDL
ncbi:MAG TPA: hypothetical protein VI752_01665 [Candidatus Paceibacterota bacterium]